MLESMKQTMGKMWRRLAGWGKAAVSGALAFVRCREKRGRLGYYTGLALLLGFIAVISVKDIFQLVTGTFPTI